MGAEEEISFLNVLAEGAVQRDMTSRLIFFLNENFHWVLCQNMNVSKGAGSFHIHRKTIKELGALAVPGVREQPNLAQNLVTHRH